MGEKVIAAAWTEGGEQRVFIGFDPARSDLGLSPSWPLFMRNLLDRAAPRSDPETAFTLVAGEIAQRAEPTSFRIGGAGAPSLRRAGRLVLIDAEKRGLYRWARGGEEGYLAVNVPAEELDNRPSSLRSGSADLPLAATFKTRETGLATLPLALLLLCLVLEWLLWRGLPAPLPRKGRVARH
jgi:hypothetical protein